MEAQKVSKCRFQNSKSARSEQDRVLRHARRRGEKDYIASKESLKEEIEQFHIEVESYE